MLNVFNLLIWIGGYLLGFSLLRYSISNLVYEGFIFVILIYWTMFWVGICSKIK